MKISYDKKEVEEIILAHAKAIFPEANYVSVKTAGYSSIQGAEVSFVAPEEKAE